MSSENAIWISSDEELRQYANQWLEQSWVAVDTEFIRSETFFPILGLVQLADTQGIYLIDPLSIADMSPLANVLTAQHICKIIHSCSEDVEVFFHVLGVYPEPLFDTQIAAAFCGYGSAIGYANLVNEIQGVEIPKQETRSDWLQRPLSQSQLLYAALDVAYLPDIYQRLCEQLKELERLHWVEKDCQQFIERVRSNRGAIPYYTKIKSAWKLRQHQLAALNALCEWRESKAIQDNVPRSRIIKDASLFDLALRLPGTSAQLPKIKQLSNVTVDNHGEELLLIIKQAIADENNYPALLPRPLDKEQVVLLKGLKACVSDIAETLDLLPELLVRKKDYENLLRSKTALQSYRLPESLTGWRQLVVGQKLLDFLETKSIENTYEGKNSE